MNTMIPKQLKFDLDLQDLPARATQVTSEALSLSGTEEECPFFSFKFDASRGTDASATCGLICALEHQTSTPEKNVGQARSGQLWCRCCK